MKEKYFISMEQINDRTYFWLKLDKEINHDSKYLCNVQLFKSSRFPKYMIHKQFELT